LIFHKGFYQNVTTLKTQTSLCFQQLSIQITMDLLIINMDFVYIILQNF